MPTMSLKDAPRLAYIEHQIIMEAAQSGELSPAVKRIEEAYSLPDGSLGSGAFRQTRVVALLFHLIALPKEILGDALNTTSVAEKWEKWSKGHNIEGCYADFLRQLRNAVAQGDPELNNDSLRFPKSKKKKNNDIIELSLCQLESFLSSVGAELATAAGRLKEISPTSTRNMR